VGSVGLPLIEGLPVLLQLRLGNSQLAGPLLQLLAPSLQSCREIVELLPLDLETLVASLKLGPLGREASLKFGPLSREADNLQGKSLLPLRKGFFPARYCELPVKHLLKVDSVGLLVGLHVRLQAGVPVGEALAFALQGSPLP